MNWAGPNIFFGSVIPMQKITRRCYAISEVQDLFGQKSLYCDPAYVAPV